MADTAIAVTAGVGTNVDTRTEATNGNHRQVVVLGDPSTNAGVAPVDATTGLKVNLGADNDVSLNAGSNAIGKLAANDGVDIGDVDVTSVVPGTAATNLGKAIDTAAGATDTGTAPLAVRDDTLATLTPVDGDYVPLRTDSLGNLWVSLGTSLTSANDTVGVNPLTSGGLSIFRSLDLDETEEAVKATAGQVYGWYIFNNAISIRYLKLYNATTATVVVGTTTPVITIPIPAQSSGGVGANALGALGIEFDTAITAAATTGVADADTGAPSANDVIVNIFYK